MSEEVRRGSRSRRKRKKDSAMAAAATVAFVTALLASNAGQGSCSSLQAPRFITSPSAFGSIVAEGRTKILQCQALGYPPPEYRWMKDGAFLSADFSPEHFYKISSVSKDDAGQYQCYARNSVGTIVSEKIPVKVSYMSSFEDSASSPADFLLRDRSLRVRVGHAAVLHFPKLDSAPEPSVSWQDDEDGLLYGTKYAVTKGRKGGRNRLVILSVDSSDEKRYRARATNTELAQEETSPWVYLEVTGDEGDSASSLLSPPPDVPPEIVVPPEDTTAVKGDELAELQCIANARPLHELELFWLKDGLPIEDAPGVSFHFSDLWNRTLTLLRIDHSHAGRYECHVRVKTGGPTLQREATVKVIEPPFFTRRMPGASEGEFGRSVTLPCDVSGAPEPEVKWLRNGVPLAETPNLRFDRMSNSSLHINFLRLEDSGVFQCVASNAAGEVVGYTWLKVKTSSPVLVNGPRNLTALDGKDATIPCEAEGAPAPNITWYLNDGEISFSGRIQILEDGSLLIAKVRSTDRGKYTCVRSNEAGSVSGSAHVTVLVRTQIVQPPVDTKVILGHVATLNCRVSADNNVPFDVSWFHEGRLINALASHRIDVADSGAILRIAEARASDAGEYTCEVRSDGGNDRHTADLDVIELPYAPTHVHAERVTAAPKTVNVSWTPGFDGNSPIIKYILQYRHVPQKGPIPDEDLNWITALANISASSRSAMLATLRSSAAYVFRVSAVNSVGEGPPSLVSERVILPQEPPSGPPLGLVGSARSEAEIMIQWQPPNEDAQNGDILGYIVRYRLFGYHDSPWSYRNVTKPLQRTYLITELITWKDYEVQIAAYNSKGVGSYSAAIKVKTREGVPSAAPTGVRAQAIDSSVVRVWWYPPDPQKINGINQGYKLQAWRYSDDPSNEDSSTPTLPSATVSVAPDLLNPLSEQTSIIDGLRPWTAYNITVLCFTSPGDGVRSPPELVRTHQDYPGPVMSLRFEDITDRGVRVLWDDPHEPNGIITGFTLRYMVKDLSHTLVERNVTADTREFRLSNLKPTTHYTFEVYALTEVGRGKASVATIQSGVEPVLPSPPTRLAVSNIEPFSVVLQFTPGFDGNSSITKWTVQALSARNATWTEVYSTEIEAPDAKAITVRNLSPYMEYELRLVASNVVGDSEPSEPTRKFQTIQAPPKHPPLNVTIRAVSATELRVRWIPLSQGEWYGIPRGYNISYRIRDDTSKLHSLSIEDPTRNSFLLDGLEEFTLYEVLLQAYNDLGSSDPSPTVLSRTREAAPGAGPADVSAEATSSTTILVKWGEVNSLDRNGIIEGYKVYYGAKGVSFRYKRLEGNQTRQTTLTELRKWSKYNIQVLAYTRVGDGVLSSPPLQERTYEDVPGPPSNMSFPDVSFTTARVIWDVPSEPNGEILKYRVSYRLLHRGHDFDNDDNTDNNNNFTREFLPTDRTFRAIGLEPMQNYEFEVTARTNLGWGYAATGLVFTTNNREAPQPPSAPQISPSQVQSREITFSWTPGSDGYAPLRHYVVQFSEGGGGWMTVPELVDPAETSFSVTSLKPFTTYKLRLQAVNDIGPSGWSRESNVTKTLPAAPAIPVENLKVTPITRTNVKVEWSPLNREDFNGDARTGGYQIEYREITDYNSLSAQSAPRVELQGYSQSKIILEDLAIGKNYEIIVRPFNSQGTGPASSPVPVYVGEAVPTGAPRDLRAEAVSPTEVRLSWRPPEADRQNGDLLGYKIFYNRVAPASGRRVEEEIEVVGAGFNSHSLIFLDMFTNYSISILGFNPAGEGPRSTSVSVRTMQGIPGPPGELSFSEITMNTLKVSWEEPERPNGEILGYIVAYETAEQDENYSKQVKQRVSERFLFVHNLEESVTYTFSVRAQTIDYGPAATGNVTTGPQPGSPGRPRDLVLSKTISAVKLTWTNGNSGKGPILGYYVESRRKATEEWQIYEDKWKTETKTEGGAIQEYLISYQNLLPTTSYNFRVIAYNKYGISLPARSLDAITTPSKRYLEFGYLSRKPFYREPWFLVSLAAASIVIVIVVVAILCVKSKSYKYKDQAKQQRPEGSQYGVAGGVGGLEDTASYATFELRQSRRSNTLKSHQSRRHTNGTMRSLASRKSLSTTATLASTSHRPHGGGGGGGSGAAGAGAASFAMISGSRQPPRPTPSMVRYSDEDDEDDSAKGYDENPDDSESLTEKPSDISSSTESSEEQESTGNSGDPSSLVNHYANVNSTFRHSQTWRRQQKSGAVAVAPPRPGGAAQNAANGAGAAASSAGTLSSRHQNGGGVLRHTNTLGRPAHNQPASLPHSQSYHNASSILGAGHAVSSAPNGGHGNGHGNGNGHGHGHGNGHGHGHGNGNGASRAGYSSFTDSDHGDASSAVVSLNGTQIVMNNMARSRAPLPGFSSFV